MAELSKKNYSIESLRLIAAFAVICIHYFYLKNNTVALIVNQWARFAVPFFFVVSGYFLAEKLKKGDQPIVYWKYFKKTISLYIAWQIIYFLNPEPGNIYIYGIKKAYLLKLQAVGKENWDFIIFKAFAQHLWFFASLSLTVIYFFIFRLKRVYWMLVISILLYIVGALTKAYAKAPFGIHTEWMFLPKQFNTNVLIFFSALPFTLGVLFSVKNINIKLGWAFVILAIGYTLHALEIWGLGELKLKQRVDFVFATVIVGLGVFLLGKARWKPLEWKPFANLGQYSLGIYAMHVLVAGWIHYTVKQMLSEEGYEFFKNYQFIFLTIGTLILSTGITYALTKIPILKRLV